MENLYFYSQKTSKLADYYYPACCKVAYLYVPYNLKPVDPKGDPK